MFDKVYKIKETNFIVNLLSYIVER